MIENTQKCSTLIYLIRRAVHELQIGTWCDTTAVYNYLAPKRRTVDSMKNTYRALVANTTLTRTLDKGITQGKWVMMQTTIKELLQEDVYTGTLRNMEPAEKRSKAMYQVCDDFFRGAKPAPSPISSNIQPREQGKRCSDKKMPKTWLENNNLTRRLRKELLRAENVRPVLVDRKPCAESSIRKISPLPTDVYEWLYIPDPVERCQAIGYLNHQRYLEEARLKPSQLKLRACSAPPA